MKLNSDKTVFSSHKKGDKMITISGTREEIETFAEGIIKANIKGSQCFLEFKGKDCSIPDFRPCEGCETDKERGVNCLKYHCEVEYV